MEGSQIEGLLRDAEVYQALARYAYLKRMVISDPVALDMLNDATYESVKKLTETAPGPSSVAYNAAMSYSGRKERIGEREKETVQVYTTENLEEAYCTWNRNL